MKKTVIRTITWVAVMAFLGVIYQFKSAVIYPSDIIYGILIGGAFGLLFAGIFNSLEKRKSKQM